MIHEFGSFGRAAITACRFGYPEVRIECDGGARWLGGANIGVAM
jgi:hypothetical protein